MMETTSKENRTSTFLRKLFNTLDLKQLFQANSSQLGIPSFSTCITNLYATTQRVPEPVIKSVGI